MAPTLRLITGASPADRTNASAGAGSLAAIAKTPQPAGIPTDTVPDLRLGERLLGPNDKVDRYIIERLIAAGGMARVYRAHHEWSRRPVALKVLRTRYAGRPDLIDCFKKEAMALGQIKHPNVVTIENGGVTANGEVFIAMEFLEGKSLREVLQERATLPIHEALSILSRVARGVAAAHEAGIVHRDIKPENIFCTSFGAVKVLDLGLAKIIGFDAKSTDPEGLIGTAAYMAPEQLEGLPADTRSDVYALGLVAYECLAGFHALVPDGVWPSRNEIALRQLTHDPRPLRELPRPLWQVVARAIHKNPAYRFVSMGDFAAALENVRRQTDAPQSADPGQPPSTVTPYEGARGRLRRRRAHRYLLTVGAPLAISVALAALVWQSLKAATSPIASPAPALPPTPSTAPENALSAPPSPAAAAARALASAVPAPRTAPSASRPLKPRPEWATTSSERGTRSRRQVRAKAQSPARKPLEKLPSSGL